MQMTEDEIYRDYKSAKDPKNQIKILAQLNCCDPQKIKDIIASKGEPVAKRKYTRRQPVTKAAPKAETKQDKSLPESVVNALKQKIKFLESSMERCVIEGEQYKAQIIEIKLFLKEHGVKF